MQSDGTGVAGVILNYTDTGLSTLETSLVKGGRQKLILSWTCKSRSRRERLAEVAGICLGIVLN